ncbi:MAG: hypothetical protein J2P57_05675 [Acidimicrobiaceae bacterium]|nr:hypothetical protein [Acidimicrobiaceae bacterium]
MLHFLGRDIEVEVDRVLRLSGGLPAVCAGSDANRQRWLLFKLGEGPERVRWVCAPVTDRVVEAVAAGQAKPADVIRHSCTGWVELVTFTVGEPPRESCLLCAEDEALLADLPPLDSTLAA